MSSKSPIIAPPIIGFSLDYETPTPEQVGSYSKMPFYALRENYCTYIAGLGAVPLALLHIPNMAENYLDLLSGLVVTGGAFDIPPSMYGASSQHETVILKENRTQFEVALLQGALKRKMPILGICGGEQLLNAVLGGSLHQHIPDAIENALEHEQKNPRHEAGHEVEIIQGTLLHKIIGQNNIAVNSAHHQAVASVSEGVIINAMAPDGVIEGIEYPEHPFCLGVQWHPEYLVTQADNLILEAFVKACRDFCA